MREILEPLALDELPRARTFDEIESEQDAQLAALLAADAEAAAELERVTGG